MNNNYIKKEVEKYQDLNDWHYDFYEGYDDFINHMHSQIKDEISEYTDLTDLENYLFEKSVKLHLLGGIGDRGIDKSFIVKENESIGHHEFFEINKDTTEHELELFFKEWVRISKYKKLNKRVY